MLHEFWVNFTGNLFKPLLLFFYMGFLVPLLKIPFEFPKTIYQGLTIYLLIAIGWHGGEELAALNAQQFAQAGGFMLVGLVTNGLIGLLAYFVLRKTTRLRNIDAAMVSGYYGSDSAGTFATCVGVLAGINSLMMSRVAQLTTAGDVQGAAVAKLEAAQYVAAPYMPVMLAVMEVPGCLVALYLISRLRQRGMDAQGNMPDEPGYLTEEFRREALAVDASGHMDDETIGVEEGDDETAHGHGGTATQVATRRKVAPMRSGGSGAHGGHGEGGAHAHDGGSHGAHAPAGVFSKKTLHEIFLNPGLYLLFGGIIIGFVGRLQGERVVADDNPLFLEMFHGALCLFLLEMGMTACSRLRDLKTAGWPFILFGIGMPTILATIGMFVAHGYSMALGQPFTIGTYVLFAVLCGAASYIAVPAVQRLAVPEASPTLPLAASLGLTFTWNVTIGIPIYLEIAKAINHAFPVIAATTH